MKYYIAKINYHKFNNDYLNKMYEDGYKYISHSYTANPNFEFVIVFEILNVK